MTVFDEVCVSTLFNMNNASLDNFVGRKFDLNFIDTKSLTNSSLCAIYFIFTLYSYIPRHFFNSIWD